MPPARVGLVGVGTIAATYVEGLRQTPGFEVAAVCARTAKSAEAFGKEHAIPACAFEALLNDPSINYVLNLTPASVHGEITHACLEAGKSVYSEKPLATTLTEADALIALAVERGLLLACAPATFLWPPLVTARRLVAEGALGSIAGALSVLVYPGPELFHPRPAHLYGPGAGPLFDMGVYQVTALIALLGPVEDVQAMASRAVPERRVIVGPDAGRRFPVATPTQFHAQLHHANGAISTLIVSFDGVSAAPPRLDIFGCEAGLSLTNAHARDAQLTLRRGMEPPETVAHDTPSWPSALAAIGPTSAWRQHHDGGAVETSATRARETLAVLAAINAAATQRRCASKSGS